MFKGGDLDHIKNPVLEDYTLEAPGNLRDVNYTTTSVNDVKVEFSKLTLASESSLHKYERVGL